MSGVRLEMANGRAYDIPTEETVAEFVEKLARGPAWRVMAFANGVVAINREQIASVIPMDWPR